MNIANYKWLAGVIAAHPNRELKGRIRLQKTVKLLQRLGFPTDYDYSIYFYGPYSESVNADIGLLVNFELVKEETSLRPDGNPSYKYIAKQETELPEMNDYQKYIDLFSNTNPLILELAATYDAYREMGFDHEKALLFLRQKKGRKCDNNRDSMALELLQQIGLVEKSETIH